MVLFNFPTFHPTIFHQTMFKHILKDYPGFEETRIQMLFWKQIQVLKRNQIVFWQSQHGCNGGRSGVGIYGGNLSWIFTSNGPTLPCLKYTVFYFLCHLFWRISSHSNWRIHTHWGLWFNLIHLLIEGMSEWRVFNQLGPGFSTLNWNFKKRSTCHLSPVKSPREGECLWITRCLELTQHWTLVLKKKSEYIRSETEGDVESYLTNQNYPFSFPHLERKDWEQSP